MIQETSLMAYRKVEPNINHNQNAIMELFYEFPDCDFTNMEIAFNLRWSVNQVTPRVFELRGLGLLVESRRRICMITGNNAFAWRVNV